MSSKAVLFVVGVSLALLLVVATGNENQEQGVDKRAPLPIQTPTTLADVIKILMDFQKRMNALESSRNMILRGRDGRDGKPGRNGRNGKPGRNGRNGKPGKNGQNGKAGRDGRDGLPGKPGRDGRNYGLPGRPGLKGEPGRPGVSVRGPPGPKSGGVQYVRWGRTTCPYNASLVYKGRTGGEYYTHSGGGANYVCLPEIPKYGRYKNGHQYAGYMYGTEYEVSTFNPLTKGHLHDHEAPCAVCYVKTKSAKMMIPATYECPAGWTREYHGYLMTERYNHNAKQFICVDQDAEAAPGTQANRNGALLYPVEGRCGSLPCSPYVEGRELTCAVCTK